MRNITKSIRGSSQATLGMSLHWRGMRSVAAADGLCKNSPAIGPVPGQQLRCHHQSVAVEGDGIMRRVSTVAIFGFGSVGVFLPLPASMLRGSAEGRKMKNPVASNAASVTAGKAAYQKYCRFCHGAEGLGDGAIGTEGSKPSDLTDEEWMRGSTDGEIFVVLRDGAGPKFEMKGFKGRMTDQDMWHVVNYIRSLAKK